MNRGDIAVEKGDIDAASREYAEAAEHAPGNVEVLYWSAVTLATTGHVEESLPLFREVFDDDRNWIDLTRRLYKPGIFPDTEEGRALVEHIITSCTPRVQAPRDARP